MHGRSLSVVSGVSGALKPQVQARETMAVAALAMLEGPADPGEMGLNLFGPLRAAEMFTACDRMRPGEVEPSVRVLMRRLSVRMRRGFVWPDALPGAVSAQDNPNLPSGYTYLLQLIAHDMVDSTISLAKGAGISFGFANARQVPLSLETIYGGGPDVCPQAYEFTIAHHRSGGLVPATRLRIGRLQNSAGSTHGCPFMDIGRAAPRATADTGLRPPAAMEGALLTEVLIADPRNDTHALLSQLTVLFHRLHNKVDEMLASAQPGQGGGIDNVAASLAFKRFMAARIAVTLVYRRILVDDVLRRILHPLVYQRYAVDGESHIDKQRGVPLEFSHAAFRFGHAMVRSSYRVNREEELGTLLGMRLSAQATPQFVPVTEDWMVDWARFFDLGGDKKPNLSRRIGPAFSGALDNDSRFPALGDDDTTGLVNRDLISACYAKCWSVPMLFAKLKDGPLRHLVPDFKDWQRPISDWLKEGGSGSAERFEGSDISDLVCDPPLPFFVLFEAAHSNAGVAPVSSGGGSRLGPVGSIIVAETIFAALRNNPVAFEDAGASLQEKLGAVGAALVGNAGVLASLGDIGTMPDLVKFMISSGAFGSAGPS